MKKYVLLIHICLLVLALTFSVVCAGLLFGDVGFEKNESIQRGIFYLINLLALVSCFVYVLKKYAKEARFYYNAFFCMQIVATVFLAIFDISTFKGGSVAILSLLALFVKAVVLIMIIFASDLGKKRAYLFFYIILTLDVLLAIMTLTIANVSVAYKVCDVFARLLIVSTIGMTIYGKYSDKESRKRS